MSTTNDEQGYYSKGIDPDGIIAAEIKRRQGEERVLDAAQDQRAPMLSDERLLQGSDPFPVGEEWHDGAMWVRNYYESLIQKGVLRVVGKVELVQGWDGALSCPCGYPHFEGRDENFCPKCGSEITKQ
jgi:hypothetical protein